MLGFIFVSNLSDIKQTNANSFMETTQWVRASRREQKIQQINNYELVPKILFQSFANGRVSKNVWNRIKVATYNDQCRTWALFSMKEKNKREIDIDWLFQKFAKKTNCVMLKNHLQKWSLSVSKQQRMPNTEWLFLCFRFFQHPILLYTKLTDPLDLQSIKTVN